MLDEERSDEERGEVAAGQVGAAWGRIVAWLEKIVAWLEKHAPVSARTLLPPVGTGELATAEARLRERVPHGFPAELKDLLCTVWLPSAAGARL